MPLIALNQPLNEPLTQCTRPHVLASNKTSPPSSANSTRRSVTFLAFKMIYELINDF